jgi:hypothetical protein
LFMSLPAKTKRIGCGFPNDQFEYTYIGVANSTKTRYIVSVDMHFFEPKDKKAGEKAKYRSRDERRGKVCRYLREKMKIRVGTIGHAAAELWTCWIDGERSKRTYPRDCRIK